MNIVCFGDSITQAYNFAEADRWPTILQFRLEALRPGFFKVYNRGVGGHTTPQALRRIKDDVIPFLPALVLVEFGINDRGCKDWIGDYWVPLGGYERDLRVIHGIVRRGGGQCVFLVNHPLTTEPAYPIADDLSLLGKEMPYDTAIREVARNLNALLIDLPALLRARKVTVRQLLSEDGCHLSAEGNHHYADAVYKGLTPVLTPLLTGSTPIRENHQ
jgi:lysophospholipase L1-like esterase